MRIGREACGSPSFWSAQSTEAIHLAEVSVAVAQSMALGVMGFLLPCSISSRRKERAFLLVSLLALTLALRVLVTGQYLITSIWPGIPFALMIKLE